MSSMYHGGSRALQAEFGSTVLADRLEEKLSRTRLTDDDKAFIEGLGFFFLATADDRGRPDCSFKGGRPGFVRVLAPDCLVFPDYDGSPRYIPNLETGDASKYAPVEGEAPVEPAWKTFDMFRDVVPPRRK
jgi:hypothetical protein